MGCLKIAHNVTLHEFATLRSNLWGAIVSGFILFGL